MRRLLIPALALAVSALVIPAASAQSFPSKPLRIVVPFPPGGPLDPLARGISPLLSRSLGQPVVVENRPGATGTIGYNICANAPDAYTMCVATTDLAILPLLMHLPFDLEKDVAPVTQLLYFRQFLIANSKAPYNNFREMVDYARTHPGKLNFGSFGEGGGAHQLIVMINRRMGINVVHVPYKGSGPALQGLLGGEVDMAVAVAATAGPLLKAGKVKVLAVNGDAPMPVFPGIRTYRDQGFDLDVRSWFGIIGSAKAPPEDIHRLNRDIVAIVADPEYRRKFMEPLYYEPIGNTPEQFAQNLKAGRAVAESIAEALKASGYRAQ
jgi:tripartite-type tricarboxylate transporter receptor subunit TctC